MVKESQHYGFFTVTGDKLRVTDPCYDHDSKLGVTLNNVRSGKWYADAVLINKNDGWGTRVSDLTVYHESCHDINSSYTEYDQKPVIAVDSGQAGFYDVNAYPVKDKKEFYDTNCSLTLSEILGGIVDGRGVAVSSGYGDGIYDLYYKEDNQGRIVAAKIIFIMEESHAPRLKPGDSTVVTY